MKFHIEQIKIAINNLTELLRMLEAEESHRQFEMNEFNKKDQEYTPIIEAHIGLKHNEKPFFDGKDLNMVGGKVKSKKRDFHSVWIEATLESTPRHIGWPEFNSLLEKHFNLTKTSKSVYAMKLRLDKLDKVQAKDAIDALKESIESGWAGVFPKASKVIEPQRKVLKPL